MTRPVPAPTELIDPDGEGVYLRDDEMADYNGLGVIMRAAVLFQIPWREVEHRTVFMYPKNDGSDEWFEIPWTWRWRVRFNVRRYSPACYAYCTPGASDD